MLRHSALIALCALAGCLAAPTGEHDGQIVGGHDTTINEYPWQVSFRLNGRHICGGSIINEYYVLTAAHCINAVSSVRSVSVMVGSTSVSGNGQVHQAQSIAAHPRYSSRTMQHDVGLIRLATPITFSDVAQPVELAAVGSAPAAGATVSVSGWGTLRSGATSIPDTLQAVDVSVSDSKKCASAYRSYGINIDSTMFCAGASGKDSCQGDSGGPIVDANKVQVGIVSFGIGCAQRGFDGVYTNLANKVVSDWVQANSRV